jgi:pilus assembly protein TadC
MKKIIGFIEAPFEDFIVPLTIVIIGVVLFIVIYNKEKKRVNKYRKDVQQKIVNDEFAKKIADKYKGNDNDVIE